MKDYPDYPSPVCNPKKKERGKVILECQPKVVRMGGKIHSYKPILIELVEGNPNINIIEKGNAPKEVIEKLKQHIAKKRL